MNPRSVLQALSLAWVAVVGCADRPDPGASRSVSASGLPSASAAAAPSGLTRVTDASLVCMMNDQFMGTPQIPTEVAGKTYYGCCAMCKERLTNNATARTGTDPVTKKSVDKASAVLAKQDSGKMLYFESEETLAAYRPGG
jgi:YHS domain-containing protein